MMRFKLSERAAPVGTLNRSWYYKYQASLPEKEREKIGKCFLRAQISPTSFLQNKNATFLFCILFVI